MYVVKRDGRKQKLDISQIRKQTIPACKDLDGVTYEELELDAKIQFKDGMSTKDIQDILTKTALFKVDVDKPNWTFVAARLMLYNLYHEIKHTYNKAKSGNVYELITLKDVLDMGKDVYDVDFSVFDIDYLNEQIVPERDLLFNAIGVLNIKTRYLGKLKDSVFELPQHMFMVLSMFLAQKEKEPNKWAKKFYDTFSTFKSMMATPTLANGRFKKGNCFSCYVGCSDDSLESIFDAFKEQAFISKFGGGIGWDYSKVRSLGGPIMGYPGRSGGKIPWLKIENDIAIGVNQLGIRNGSINVYIAVWDKDIYDFIDLKKSGGEERRTAEDLFISIILDDVFMERVENDEEFTLFDPYDTPELNETYGDDFRKMYKYYEEKFKADPNSFHNKPKVVKAKDLFKYAIKMYWDKGMPFLMFKDTSNKANPNPDEGIIRTSNLCMEIMLPTSPERTAVCNLASVNMAKAENKDDLVNTVEITMRALDNVIDVTYYVSEKTEKEEKKTRAVGLGIMGEAEALAKNKIMYGSKKHEDWIKEWYELVYSSAYNYSEKMAKERGPWKEGKDTRNAWIGAIAPTGTISLVTGTTSSHEAVFATKWTEETLLGVIPMTAPGITPETFPYYVSAYDIDQVRTTELTGLKQSIMNKYLGQSISHNMYFIPQKTDGKYVYDTIMSAWKNGMKTIYYLRVKSLKTEQKSINDGISCYGCS